MSAYAEAVEHYLTGFESVNVGGCPACSECGIDADDDSYDGPEPFFSRHGCECCGSHLGGDRHPAHGLADGEVVHLDVCTDCLFYLAYGDEPD